MYKWNRKITIIVPSVKSSCRRDNAHDSSHRLQYNKNDSDFGKQFIHLYYLLRARNTFFVLNLTSVFVGVKKS